MTTKFTALAVFLLCFMPASKIEHTQASLLSTKKTKHEEAKLLTHINQDTDTSFSSLSADKDKKKIKPIKLSANTEKKEEEKQKKTNDKEETYSQSEKELLSRLVHAEAKGESYEGKVAVASVVLNRTEKKGFPDTIRGVIYQKNAFEPVANGSINQKPDKESIAAAEEALSSKNRETDAIFFYNPKTASDDWIRSRKIVERIGGHVFAI
ncbi:cell wall hydrolase [Bacillus inaquosorum]|uniref:cell wall hydrolase n=1 Tax=Bacillus inaquosorum TaxID=483913 RepID=UPI002281D481|nr:cell wall hydrolase [Bacillus inaquosorum]MCY7767596.1 cell wall hydrolase [Bacillus inaquosorum]MCY7907941.1 cell wall hydrolase [Bacillus inaquosorum]MCY7974885.1 cell wall hydrolase [Bacillus inaquosorum]MCY8860705.1 cell wall hydrolase [Bacillus inaquosorum]MCY8875492.1 cell wall hydrolase [Bacillus inaquosorum]